MDRVLRGVSATLSQTVLVDETGTDPSPDAAIVNITRADGTPVATNAAAINGANGGFQYVLTPLETALLDTLRVDWTFTLGGQVQTLTTYVEIVGGFHFPVTALRAAPGLASSTDYPTAKLVEARTLAETIMEDACGRAFVPRYWYGQVDGFRWPYPDVRALRSVVNAYDGTIMTANERLDALFGRGWRYHRYAARWEVGLEHGMDAPPADVSRASLLLARSILIGDRNTGGTLDERATSVSYADAGLTYSLTTAGVRGAPTSVPETNAVIDRYRIPAIA